MTHAGLIIFFLQASRQSSGEGQSILSWTCEQAHRNGAKPSSMN